MLPCNCPSCERKLQVKSLVCKNCGTEVTGSYELPQLLLLSRDELHFIMNFVKHSGSLKEMSSILNLSYPTVRNLLNEIINKIENYEK